MNTFEALCKLASEESWCCDLYCTTCGHMHFKYAFKELAKGRSPEDKGWVIHKSEDYLHRYLGQIPKKYTEFEKHRVLRFCYDADISSIEESCKFPDWLGYLGLVLEHMRSGSKVYKLVSSEWALQLMFLMPEYSQINERLSKIAEGESSLNIKDLEACEKEYAAIQ